MNRLIKRIVLIFAIIPSALVLFTNASVPPDSVIFNKQIDVTFKELSATSLPLLQEQIDLELGQNCYGEGVRRGPSNYRCGEYPLGQIISNDLKKLPQVGIDLPDDSLLVKFDDGSVRLKKRFKMEVYLSRNQKASWVTTPLLDSKTTNSLRVQEALFETMTVRFNPMGTSLFSIACAYLPGVHLKTEASDFDTMIKYSWRFLFVRGTEKISTYTKIKDGKFNLENAKICAIYKTVMVEKRPQTSLVDVSYPQVGAIDVMAPLAYNTQVEFHTLGAKIANWLLGFFGILDLEKVIAGELEKQMKKQFDSKINVTLNQIRNGKAFEKVFAETLNIKLTRDIAKVYQKYIQKQVDTNPLVYRERASQFCQRTLMGRNSNGGPQLLDSVIQGYCDELYATIEVVPFTVNARYNQLGCYKYSWSPMDYTAAHKNTWWQASCGLSSQVTVKLDPSGESSAQCFEQTQSVAPQSQQAHFMDCDQEVYADVLPLPEPVVQEILEQKLSRLSEIQNLARARGVSESTVSRLNRYLQ